MRQYVEDFRAERGCPAPAVKPSVAPAAGMAADSARDKLALMPRSVRSPDAAPGFDPNDF